MASTPTIPTSFLPHQGAAARSKTPNSDLIEALVYFTYVVFVAVFMLAVGVFLYGHALLLSKASKDAKLAEEVGKLDVASVPAFVRLRDRLTSTQKLLDAHVMFSQVFPAIESIMPSTVRFTSMHIAFGDKNIPKVDAEGVAKSFNSLAVASADFANDPRIKNALFSVKNLNKDGSASFSFTASIDPKVITFVP